MTASAPLVRRADRRAPCACGGGCPRCRSSPGAAPPRRVPSPARLPVPRIAVLETDSLEAEAIATAEKVIAMNRPEAVPEQHEADLPREGRSFPSASRSRRGPAAGVRCSARTEPPSLGSMRTPRTRFPGVPATAPPWRELGAGEPLADPWRTWVEDRFGIDFSAVRLHRGRVASALADHYHARAFTFGSHIVFAADAPRADTTSGRVLLAHELTHTVQQASPFGRGEVSSQALPRGPPARRVSITQRVGSCAVQRLGFPDVSLPSLDDVTGAVVDLGEGAWDTAAAAGGAAYDFAADSLSSVVEYFAPGVLAFVRGGFAGQLTDLFCSGLDALVGSLLSPLEDLDIVSTIQETFSSLTEGVRGMWSGLGAGASAAVGALMRPLVEAIQIYGDPILQGMSDAADSADGIFSSLWDNVGVPVLDFLESVGGAVWEGFSGIVDWISEATAPLRARAEEAWDWLCEQFNLAWESTSGIRDWLAEKASELWDSFVETIEPIRAPLMAVAGPLLLLSPLGPIVILTQIVPPLYEKIVWLWNNWNTEEILVQAREILANDILPGIIGLVSGVSGAIASAAAWLAGVTADVASTFGDLLGAFGANSCLTAVTRVLNHVAEQFNELADWAEEGFTGLGDAIRAVFDALAAIFQPILDFLLRLIMVALNPPLLPIALTAAIWLLCPDDLKPPVVNFVLGFIIEFVRGFPGFLTGLGVLAGLIKAATISFLEQLRAADDPVKVRASNKVANIAAGGGPQFVAGYAVGLLEGILDGILDPIRLIVMLVRVVGAVCQAIGDRLAPLILEGVPPVGAAVSAFTRAMAVPPPVAAGTGTAESTAAADTGAGEVEPPMPEMPTVEVPSGEGATGSIQGRRRSAGSRAIRAPRPNPTPAEAPPAAADRFGGPRGLAATPSSISPARGAEGTAAHSQMAPAVPTRSRGEISHASRSADAAPPETIPVPDPTASASAEEMSAAGSAAGEDIAPPPAVEGVSALAEGEGEFEVLPSDAISDEALAGAISPGTISAIAGSGSELEGADAEIEAGGEAEARESGSTVDGLAGLLSGVWDQLIAGARGIGRSVADALLRFLQLGDYEIGNKIGYVAGMVLLEVLLTIFSGGAWLEASAAAKFLRPIVRLLDLGGEIMGAVARGFRAVRGPLMRGLGAARGFLGRFRVAGRILDKLESAAHFLFRFGDEAASAGSHGGSRAAGHADDVARHADDAARHADDVGRHADDAGRHADDPSRRADDAGRRADDAAREAAERPAAIAMARGICETNDAIQPSPPASLVLAQLMAMRTQFTWIDTFRADRKGPGCFEFHLIASDTVVDNNYTVGTTAGVSRPHSEMSVDELRSLARTDSDAAFELWSRYRNMPREELRRLARQGDDTAQAVLRQTEVPGSEPWLDPHEFLSRDPGMAGQSHHLDQNAAFRDLIPRDEGLAVKLEGNAFTQPGTPHYEAHRSMETFWDQFRSGGARFGQRPNQFEYTRAVRDSMIAAGFTREQALAIARASLEHRLRQGLAGTLVPRIPGRLPQVQPKLTVAQSGNVFEREADAVAEAVPTANPRSTAPAVSDYRIQSAHADSSAAPIPGMSRFKQALDASECQGGFIPDPTRRRMETHFGVDFRDVRIHSDHQAAALNARIGSEAFAAGRHVYFAPGRFRPETRTGERLLAHELTHVVQQSGGRAPAVRSSPQKSDHGSVTSLERPRPTTVFRQVAPRPVARRTDVQILGDPAAAAPVPGMTLSEFRNYTREQADWFVEPTLAAGTLRDDLWGLLLAAEEGPHMLSGIGDVQVSALRGVAAADWPALRAYCRGTHSSGDTVRIFPPLPPLADRITLGRTLLGVEAVIPPAVLEVTVSQVQLEQVQTQALLPRLTAYWTDFQPHIEQTFSPAAGARGPEFERVLTFLNSLGGGGLAPLAPLRGATPADRWVRNLHRFPLPMLLKLVSNLGVTTGLKRFILVLHTGHDAPGAFQESASLFSDLVLHSANNLVLMIEGATSLADITTRIPGITTTWGKLVGGVRRISQVLIAGHGSAQSVGMAGTGAPTASPDAVSYPEESLDIGGTPAERVRTQALLDALLTNMDPAAARILFAGCLVGSTRVAAGTAGPAIPAALAANQSLGAFTEARAVAAGLPAGRVQAARASVALGSATSLFNAAGNLAVTYPFDPNAFGGASTYASTGVEPEGVLRAAVEVGANNAVTAETVLRSRLAMAASGGWYDTVTRLLVGLALPPVAVPPAGVNLARVNELANVAEIPFLAFWPQFGITAAHFTSDVNPQPFAADIYTGIAATVFYTNPVAHDTQRMRLLLDQGALALNGAAHIPTFRAGILATALSADAFESFLDLGILAPHAAALLPLGAVPSVEQIRLALAWFFQDDTNAHVRSFLTAQVNQPAGAPAAFTAAVSAEIAAAGRTDREILDQLGFAPTAAAAAVGGAPPLPLANLALRGSATNTLLVSGRIYAARVIAAPHAFVRRGPGAAEAAFMTLGNGATVRVTGSTSGWAAVDVWGQLGFISLADLSPPPP